MAYFDDEDDENSQAEDMVGLADDTFDADKYGEQLVQRQEAQGQSLENEFDAMPMSQANQVGVPKAPEMPKAATKQIQNAPEKYSGLMDEYKALQEKRGKQLQYSAVIDGLSQIGQAMAAGKKARGFEPKSNMALFEKFANQPVTDYQDRVKQQGLDLQLGDMQRQHDPNNSVAKTAAQMMEQRGYKPQPGMNQVELSELQKLGDPLKTASERQGLLKGDQSIDLGEQNLKKNTWALEDLENDRSVDGPGVGAWRSAAIKAGIPEKDVQNASRRDLENLIKLYNEQKRSNGSQFQMKNRYNPQTGQVEQVLLNTATGEVVDTGGITGYSIRDVKNERTGEREVFNPALGRVTGSLSSAVAQTPEQANKPVPEINKGMIPQNKIKQVDEYRKQFIADTKDERAALQAAVSTKDLLAAGKALDGDIMRAIQNKLSIATGNKGATSENDVAPLGGRQSILDRINRQMSFWTQGKFPEGDREFLTKLTDIMAKSSQRELDQSSEFYSNNLYKDLKSDPNVKADNFTPESVREMLGSDVYGTSSKKKQLPPGIVRRKGPDGKISLFDEKTKEWKGYE